MPRSVRRWGDAGGTATADVTAGSTFGTDNVAIRSDGTGRGVQASGVVISDTDAISGVASITMVGAGTVDGRDVSADGTVLDTALTAAAALATDNVVVRADGTGRGTQTSGVVISDTNAISGVASIAMVGAGTVDGRDVSADGTVLDTALTAAAALATDNVVVRADGTGRGTQTSGVVISDTNAITGVAALTMSGVLTAASDTDSTHIIGRVRLSFGGADTATFGHFDAAGSTLCLTQHSGGNNFITELNTASNGEVRLQTAGADRLVVTATAVTAKVALAGDTTITATGDIDAAGGFRRTLERWIASPAQSASSVMGRNGLTTAMDSYYLATRAGSVVAIGAAAIGADVSAGTYTVSLEVSTDGGDTFAALTGITAVLNTTDLEVVRANVAKDNVVFAALSILRLTVAASATAAGPTQIAAWLTVEE